MSFTLRSTSSASFSRAERSKRNRLTIATLDRFSSFNENKSSSVENRRRSFQLTPNLIELLEEDEEDTEDHQGQCYECTLCSKIFASEYGVNHHISMYHPNQSVLCSHCQITFRSHRSLKTHQQRRHAIVQTRATSKNLLLPNYGYMSTYLVSAFSSRQFPLIAKNACEQQHLPLGELSSKLFQCHICSIPFPCSRSLKYHLLNKHEQYEYKYCEQLLMDIIAQVEYNLRTVDHGENVDNANRDDVDTIKLVLAKQASEFGLIDKTLLNRFRSIQTENDHVIFPKCLHKNRTCANLCLQYISSYPQLTQSYPLAIEKMPKGSAFNQGSIVSISTTCSNGSSMSSTNDSYISNDLSNGRQKRKNFKQTDNSPIKKKSNTHTTTTDSKTNHAKSSSIERAASNGASTSVSPRKLSKDNSTRSTSHSSNTTISQRSSKRNLSPSTATSSEKRLPKRHQTRQQTQNNLLSSATTSRTKTNHHENNIEQENGNEDSNDDDDDNDVIPIECEETNQQRHTSSSSMEYIETLNNDSQSASSLNNIENLKGKSTPETSLNGNDTKKSNVRKTSHSEEQVRVRCKICGEILEGRSVFSQHVIAKHSHLMKKNITEAKQHQTAIVR